MKYVITQGPAPEGVSLTKGKIYPVECAVMTPYIQCDDGEILPLSDAIFFGIALTPCDSEGNRRIQRTEGAERMSPVEQAAFQWWLSRRPLSYNEDQHLDNPTVNTFSDAEKALARAVAEIVIQAEAKV